jgi:hypothetical protein
VAAGKTDAEVLEALYWSALSRPPTDRERTAILTMLGRTPGADPGAARRGLEDLTWAVLTSTEFLFAH